MNISSEVLIDHIGYSDESHHSAGKYRAISLFSLTKKADKEVKGRYKQILDQYGKQEFKWKKLRSYDYECFSKDILDLVFDALEEANDLRIDTLYWDTEDSRHNVSSRDDVENFVLMYYKLIKNVLTERWPSRSVWKINSHQYSAIDFNELEIELKKKQIIYPKPKDPRLNYWLNKIEEIDSEKKILSQIPDLFAGVSVFFAKNMFRYEKWKEEEIEEKSMSNSEIHRFRFLKYFLEKLRNNSMHIKLRNDGLYTPHPGKPINFWFYRPQSPKDKAPTK